MKRGSVFGIVALTDLRFDLCLRCEGMGMGVQSGKDSGVKLQVLRIYMIFHCNATILLAILLKCS
jgi:hypothetical protein